MKRILLSLLALFFLILLLLSPGTALEGARKGLLLWAYTVLPTLLPFMIGTGVIAAMGAVGLVVKPFSPLLSGVFHFSQPAGFVFLSMFFLSFSVIETILPFMSIIRGLLLVYKLSMVANSAKGSSHMIIA